MQSGGCFVTLFNEKGLTILDYTVPFQSIRLSHVTGPSVLSKIGPCHRSQRPMFRRSSVTSCLKREFGYKTSLLTTIFTSFAHVDTDNHLIICVKHFFSTNNPFLPVQCLKIHHCHRSPAQVSKCPTDPMCHCCEYTDIFPFFFIIYSFYYFSDIFLTLII
jgi:hypothetical protein